MSLKDDKLFIGLAVASISLWGIYFVLCLVEAIINLSIYLDTQ